MLKLVREIFSVAIAIIEVLLVLRFILRLLGARSASPFVTWVYEATQPLLQPFLFAFPTPSVAGGFVLEFTTIFALFAYAVIGYIVYEVLTLIAGK